MARGQDALAPTARSGRRNTASATVMLVNISPAAELQKGTVNALRYGQLYAGARGGGVAKAMLGKGGGGGRGRGKGGGAAAAGGAKPWHRDKPAATAATVPCDPGVLAALRAIYAEHVPDKTAKEVSVAAAHNRGGSAIPCRTIPNPCCTPLQTPRAGAED